MLCCTVLVESEINYHRINHLSRIIVSIGLLLKGWNF